MHRCLLVLEIVGLICGECGKSSKSDLASLARTSRNFQEPALRYLWYELDDITPLIKCMPRNLWKVKGGKLVFRRAFTERDWSNFQEYAQRVRIIHIVTAWQHVHVAPEEYQILSMAAGGRALLPNLTEISWKYEKADQSLPFIHLFLSRQLTTFRIWVPDSLPPSHFSILDSLGTQHPALTTVGVQISGQNPKLASLLSTAICRWSDLRCLEANAVSSDALVHLANLPSLQVLRLGYFFQTNTPTEFPPGFPHSNAFPSLKTLEVSRHTLAFCIKLLNSMSNASLTSIRFSGFCFCSTFNGWTDLLFAIRTVCCPSSLLDLHINDYHPHSLGTQLMHTHIHTKDHLRSLLDFHNLNSVDLVTGGTFDIDDTMVKEVAIAWPKVETLSLIGNTMWFKSRITLAGLRSLVKHCPELKAVTLAFDARSVPPAEATPRISCQLHRLNVVNSPIQHSGKVAAFLSDVFPNMKYLDCCGNEGDDLYDLWMNVSDLMEEFESVRAQTVMRERLVDKP